MKLDRPISTQSLYADITPWIVLATGTFITACAINNFMPMELLKQPITCSGVIGMLQGRRIGQVLVPDWFPVVEAILQEPDGALCTKARDLPVPSSLETLSTGEKRVTIDLSDVPFATEPSRLHLTYFPWFRFLSEPISFNATGRVASYIADAFRFLLARHGHSPEVHDIPGGREIRVAGLRIEVIGESALQRIRILEADAATAFDLETWRIEIDRRMFPVPYAAGAALLESPDRLLNLDLTIDIDRLVLSKKSS